MDKEVMNVKEIADYLGLHTDTVYDLVRDNAIPHFKIGKRILFSKEAIENWIRSQIMDQSENQ
ncbi:DNA-binding protein [Oceanobacillus piezotolerans]|uniref:DNA-binding protein n=1 Tax=Oceanobacillus piezotolerans TaxID=2448030 RepID=A0A498DER1_9BACI|nr:helix-turn-helix domain-containing protein [Oceanobacillus piezotolerans]RLL45484.1 DNA-binding protein [Oceanobacillus piezotolerans]